jgi:aldehyde:ferredoxin oxidoreductase
VFVKGISEKPVYIFIDKGNITFRDASHLWGKTTEDTEHAIKEELGDKKIGIALIGPAGERKSNIAAIMNDTHRAAARGGPGAVMGSKNFKALVCRGDSRIEVHSKADVVALNKELAEWGKTGPVADNIYQLFYNYGTGGLYESNVYSGDANVKNWGGVPSDLTDDGIKAITSQSMDKRWKTKKYTCNTCSLGCGAIYEIKDGKFPIKETGRPEYEANAMFGSNLGIECPELVNWCNYLCNEYGFDLISFGGTIAWAMECFENGLFTVEETGGIDLSWGNVDGVAKLAEAICKGSSAFGLALNKGAFAAAKHYNRGIEYVMHASGIEAPAHDPRLNPGLARTFQYDPTPARHVKGGQGFTPPGSLLPQELKYAFDDPEQAVRDVAGVIEKEITNLGGFCEFTDFAYPPGIKVKILSAVIGTDYTGGEERKLGLRSYTMRHAFNLREGLRREDNTISGRIIGKPAMKDGPHTGSTIDNEKLADAFFKALDWDLKTLVPSKAALEEIGGLEKVIADLHGK